MHFMSDPVCEARYFAIKDDVFGERFEIEVMVVDHHESMIPDPYIYTCIIQFHTLQYTMTPHDTIVAI